MSRKFQFSHWLLALTFCWSSSGCEWSDRNRLDTENHFRKNKSDYLTSVANVKSGRDPVGVVASAMYSSEVAPVIVEFSPINFYYAVVYVDDRKNLERSIAMNDEGTFLKDFGNGFYLVRRGFN